MRTIPEMKKNKQHHRKRRPIVALFLAGLLLACSSGQVRAEDTLTYTSALEKARANHSAHQVYQELIDYLEKKAKEVKANPYANNPDYEYVAGQEIEVYNNSYKTYDYEKLLKERKNAQKVADLRLEQETLAHFIGLTRSRKDLELKALALDKQQRDTEVAQLKLRLGLATASQAETAKGYYEASQSEMTNLKGQHSLLYRKFNDFMGMQLSSRYELDLTELMVNPMEVAGQLKLPAEALAFAKENKKSLQDMTKDLKDFKEDMKRYSSFYPEGTYFYKEKQKELDKKLEDIHDTDLKQKYAFDKAYSAILKSIQDMEITVVDRQILLGDIANDKAKYEAGILSAMDYEKKRISMRDLEVRQLQSLLLMKSAILDYNLSMEN